MDGEQVEMFNVRSTSLIAYYELIDKGGGLTQEQKIVDLLRRCSAKSLQEICSITGMAINAVSGRVNGLKKKGIVIEHEKRKCTVTGRLVIPVSV
mgnify:CR=1 FL=1|jgi:hypothetical protein